MFGSTNATPPKAKKLANIDADQTASNQQAIPVRYISGRRRVALHYIAPAYNVRTEKVTVTTGKDQTSTVGYIYYGDLAGLLALGGRAKINHLFRLIFDSAIEWDGDIAADSDPYEAVTVINRGLFRILWGTTAQPVDDLVLTPISPTLPGGVDPRDTTTWPGGDWTNKHP
jgi:hypothetical protein